MWEICANQLLPKALESCPKSYKSPNLVTVEVSDIAAKFNKKNNCRRVAALYQSWTTLKDTETFGLQWAPE